MTATAVPTTVATAITRLANKRRRLRVMISFVSFVVEQLNARISAAARASGSATSIADFATTRSAERTCVSEPRAASAWTSASASSIVHSRIGFSVIRPALYHRSLPAGKREAGCCLSREAGAGLFVYEPRVRAASPWRSGRGQPAPDSRLGDVQEHGRLPETACFRQRPRRLVRVYSCSRAPDALPLALRACHAGHRPGDQRRPLRLRHPGEDAYEQLPHHRVG